jgi:hypothetical protein
LNRSVQQRRQVRPFRGTGAPPVSDALPHRRDAGSYSYRSSEPPNDSFRR